MFYQQQLETRGRSANTRRQTLDTVAEGTGLVKFVALSRATICLLNFTALSAKMGKSPGTRAQCRVWEIDRRFYLPLCSSVRLRESVQSRGVTSPNLVRKSNFTYFTFPVRGFRYFHFFLFLRLSSTFYMNDLHVITESGSFFFFFLF